MNKPKFDFKTYLAPVLIAAILYGIYYYGASSGIRYCNCKATEDWKPDGPQQAGGRTHGGSRFYHK
ncbi:hypothetical protein [Chitinophaga sp.]|uniref:hypothetical protein n=1 Tax=Chitinophaga sp. TaxID=1869181 RepID=UPI002630F8A0|nr:hypothetical protein [uncultured Chitinophaga sp.]